MRERERDWQMVRPQLQQQQQQTRTERSFYMKKFVESCSVVDVDGFSSWAVAIADADAEKPFEPLFLFKVSASQMCGRVCEKDHLSE